MRSYLEDHNYRQVIYDSIKTNKGSGYSSSTGIFTAPMEGTYVFIWNAMTYHTGNYYCELYLYRNSIRQRFQANADARGRTDGHDNGSNCVLLSLNVGDRVGIRTKNCNYLYPEPNTSFSGFKI